MDKVLQGIQIILLNELSTMKLILDDEVQALLLLFSLIGIWETLIMSLSNLAPTNVMTISMVKYIMLNEKSRMKNHGISSHSEALVTSE